MSRIYKSLPPKGTPLGIAFSGGREIAVTFTQFSLTYRPVEDAS